MLRLQKTEKATEKPHLNEGVAYLLWCLCFFQFYGIQRLYSGKTISGLIYLCTFGVFGIGQLLDLFMIPKMVRERNIYLRGLHEEQREYISLNIGKVKVPELLAIDSVSALSPMHQLLKVAKNNNNVLSQAQAVLLTGLDPELIDLTLNEALKRGYAEIGNDPETGSVRYYFDL